MNKNIKTWITLLIACITFIAGIASAWTIQKSDISYLRRDVNTLQSQYNCLSDQLNSLSRLSSENNAYLKIILEKIKEK